MRFHFCVDTGCLENFGRSHLNIEQRFETRKPCPIGDAGVSALCVIFGLH